MTKIHNFIKEHVTECKPCAERKAEIKKKILEYWNKVSQGKEKIDVEKGGYKEYHEMKLEGDGYVDENGEIHFSVARETK